MSDDAVSTLGPLSKVDVDITVEFGQAQLKVRDLLALHRGSVVRLSKAAGEPVDLLVNGTLAARGSLVVVDGRLGVKVTEVVGG